MRDVLLGQDPRPASRPTLKAPRIGFCRTLHWADVDPAARELTEKAVADLIDAGALIDEIDLPERFAVLDDVHKEVMAYETRFNYTFEQLNHSAALSKAFADFVRGRQGYFAGAIQGRADGMRLRAGRIYYAFPGI